MLVMANADHQLALLALVNVFRKVADGETLGVTSKETTGELNV